MNNNNVFYYNNRNLSIIILKYIKNYANVYNCIISNYAK